MQIDEAVVFLVSRGLEGGILQIDKVVYIHSLVEPKEGFVQIDEAIVFFVS